MNVGAWILESRTGLDSEISWADFGVWSGVSNLHDIFKRPDMDLVAMVTRLLES